MFDIFEAWRQSREYARIGKANVDAARHNYEMAMEQARRSRRVEDAQWRDAGAPVALIGNVPPTPLTEAHQAGI